MQIPYVNRKQISDLDRIMVKDYKISVTVMMELAGYRIAEFIRLISDKKKILILVGKGNNGGDGICAARHLRNFGYLPKLFLITEDLNDESQNQIEITNRLKIPIITDLEDEINDSDIIIDCLIGYNLKGEPRKSYSDVIKLANSSEKTIVSCDMPSGVDTDNGAIHDVYVKSTHILFLSLPKIGCKDLDAKKYTADIGVPKEVYTKIGVESRNYFEKEAIVKND